jgi:hypothetical protein
VEQPEGVEAAKLPAVMQAEDWQTTSGYGIHLAYHPTPQALSDLLDPISSFVPQRTSAVHDHALFLVRYGQIVFPASASRPPLRGIHPSESLGLHHLLLHIQLVAESHKSSGLHIRQQDHHQQELVLHQQGLVRALFYEKPSD